MMGEQRAGWGQGTADTRRPPPPGWGVWDNPLALLAALELGEGRAGGWLAEIAVLQDMGLPWSADVLVVCRKGAFLSMT